MASTVRARLSFRGPLAKPISLARSADVRAQFTERMWELFRHYELEPPDGLLEALIDKDVWRALAMRMALDTVPCFRPLKETVRGRAKGGRPRRVIPELGSTSPPSLLVQTVDAERGKLKAAGQRARLDAIARDLKRRQQLPTEFLHYAPSTIVKEYHRFAKRLRNSRALAEALARREILDGQFGTIFGLPGKEARGK